MNVPPGLGPQTVADASPATAQQASDAFLRLTGDAVFTLSADGRVLFANPAALALSSREAVVELPVGDAYQFESELTARPFEWALGPESKVVTVCAPALGDSVFEMSVHPLSNIERPSEYLVVLHDITQRRKVERNLSVLKGRDPLTGLINQRSFQDRLHTFFPRAKHSGSRYVLVQLSLDQFDLVHAIAGVSAGDALFKTVAAEVQKTLVKGETLARLDGGKLGLLLAEHSGAHVKQRCQVLCDTVSVIAFEWEETAYPVTASVGAAVLDADADSVESLWVGAATACELIKEQGGKGVHVCSKGDSSSQRQLADMQWIGRIQTALQERRILIYGQQIWDLKQHSGRHLEVLISMRDTDGDLVPPTDFLPAAERYGLMPAIDQYVMEAVFRHIAPLQAKLQAEKYQIAINLSGQTVGSVAALDAIRKLFHRYAIEPSLICFEVTETAVLRSMDEAQRFLQVLKRLGCQIALDDFGTGFSNFSYLKAFPVDILKIDGQFVREMLHDETDYSIVESLHNVANTMGLTTVAECVENADVLRELTRLGVAYGQGVYLSQRRPLKEIISKQILAV